MELSPGPKSVGCHLRISEPCAAAVFAGDPAYGPFYADGARRYSQARYHSDVRGRGEHPARSLARLRACSGAQVGVQAAANEAGILLMHKDLQEYVGGAAAIGSAGASDSWLLAPGFCSCDERSRNLIDRKGRPDLSRSKAAKGRGIGTRSRLPVQVTVTSGKVPVTLGKVPVTPAAGGEIVWQAGMCKRMSHVRSYIRLQVAKSREYRRRPDEQPENSENHPQHPGMYKGMNSLAGYVAPGGREYWDF